MKIFWSWQSDLEPASHKTLVQRALIAAIDLVAAELEVDEADRLEIDHDTKGTAGAGEIAKIIFDKIDVCAAFVADVTPVGKTEAGKWLPNPNVMIETGWALRARTHEKVILVLNLASGCRIEDLPFDLRSRRCMTYTCPAGASSPERAKVQGGLAKDLAAALRTNLAVGAATPGPDLSGLLTAAEPDGSVWAGSAKTIDLLPTRGFGGSSFRVPARPRAYLRMVPAGWDKPVMKLARYAELDITERPQASHAGSTNGDFGAQANGYVDVWFASGSPDPDFVTATKFHEKTGEIWSVWSAPDYGSGKMLALDSILQLWATSLKSGMVFLDRHGAKKLRLIEAGLVGADGFSTPGQFRSEQHVYRKGEARHRVTQSDWSEDAQLVFLSEAFGEVCDLVMLDGVPPEKIKEFLNWQ